MPTAGEIVTSWIHAVERDDLDDPRRFLAEDAVFDNVPQEMPAKLCVGPDNIARRLRLLVRVCEKVEWEILGQVEQGGTVFNERVDRFWFKPGMFPKGDVLAWPVCARWEVEDGRIKLWRDYYEMGLTLPQLGVDLPEFGRIIGQSYGA